MEILMTIQDDAEQTQSNRRIPFCLAVLAILSFPPAASAAVCSAGAFSCPASGTCIITGTWDVGSGCALDFGTQAVELRGTLRSDSVGGSFAITTGSLNLVGGKLRALGNTYIPGGDVTVHVAGAFGMTGTGPRMDVSGNAGGGTISIDAGSINLNQGVIASDGGVGANCGDGGLIDLEAGSGSISVAASVHATTSGGDCLGGSIYAVAPTITISGDLDARGGGSGADDAISLDATFGDLVITSTATLRADGIGQPGGSGAGGGGIALVADQGSVTTAAASISATGKSPDGPGGDVAILSATSMQVSSPINVSSGGTGEGGTIAIDSGGSLTLSGSLTAQGGSSFPDGLGGEIDITSNDGLSLSSALDVSAASGGDVDIESLGLANLTGSISARGSYGPGGSIELSSCSVTLSGTVDAGSSFSTTTGALSVTGAAVSVGSTAHLSALPCTASDCTQLSAPDGGLTIAPGASVSPTANLIPYLAPPGC